MPSYTAGAACNFGNPLGSTSIMLELYLYSIGLLIAFVIIVIGQPMFIQLQDAAHCVFKLCDLAMNSQFAIAHNYKCKTSPT